MQGVTMQRLTSLSLLSTMTRPSLSVREEGKVVDVAALT